MSIPRPVDDQVLLGMKALTSEAGFTDRKVSFSQYQLCKAIGWEPSGRSYERLEQSLDRIASTTFKFKNAWWDSGEAEWRSHTFHLIDNLELSSRGRYEKRRRETGRRDQDLCYFVWNEIVWKSFTDGFIKKVDMKMFRKIAKGRRREVPLRLFRWLDKQFYRRGRVTIDLEKLCYGTLGLRETYPSELRRILERACHVLIANGFLGSFEFSGPKIAFLKQCAKASRKRQPIEPSQNQAARSAQQLTLELLQERFPKVDLSETEAELIRSRFGTDFEQKYIQDEIRKGRSLKQAGPVRLGLLYRFLTSQAADNLP